MREGRARQPRGCSRCPAGARSVGPRCWRAAQRRYLWGCSDADPALLVHPGDRSPRSSSLLRHRLRVGGNARISNAEMAAEPREPTAYDKVILNYARFLVRRPRTMLTVFTLAVFGLLASVLIRLGGTGTNPFRYFSEPDKGFEPRGTPLSNKLLASSRMLEKAQCEGTISGRPDKRTYARYARGALPCPRASWIPFEAVAHPFRAPYAREPGLPTGTIRTLSARGARTPIAPRSTIAARRVASTRTRAKGAGSWLRQRARRSPTCATARARTPGSSRGSDTGPWPSCLSQLRATSTSSPSSRSKAWRADIAVCSSSAGQRTRARLASTPTGLASHRPRPTVCRARSFSAGMCRVDDLVRSQPSFARACATVPGRREFRCSGKQCLSDDGWERSEDTEHSCCPSRSVGSYVALLARKASCDEITADDVSRAKALLEKCERTARPSTPVRCASPIRPSESTGLIFRCPPPRRAGVRLGFTTRPIQSWASVPTQRTQKGGRYAGRAGSQA